MAPPPRQPRIDRSFLGETAIRLARLLGVGGLISPEFDSGEKVLPVVLVGDATQAGYRGQALRCWSHGETVAAAAGNTSKLAIKAPPGNGIIVDGFLFTSGTTGLVRVGQLGADDADPFVIGQTNTRWTERLATTSEGTGILTQGHNADALTYGIEAILCIVPANTMNQQFEIPFMLAPGGKLIIHHTVVNVAINVTVWGRSL